MKATAQNLPASVTAEKSLVAVFSELVKARLTFLVLLTTLVGYFLGATRPIDFVHLLGTLFGTGLLACGAAALNQLLERQYDARMARTEDRPLPSGRLQSDTVLIFGGACSVVGMLYLSLAINVLTGLLG